MALFKIFEGIKEPEGIVWGVVSEETDNPSTEELREVFRREEDSEASKLATDLHEIEKISCFAVKLFEVKIEYDSTINLTSISYVEASDLVTPPEPEFIRV